ncbi:Phosphoribosylformylglycinamidine cyclo-ligase [hydrothermal vent metagenome]|uniref:Phosphoribosylformylglycinamidine cyclo-ligase n=1 Tax=hydrothermal vent metagenome TaxID=652676 RepID=A0A3B1DJY4_9ZZZZ
MSQEAYKNAGVDIEAGNEVVQGIKPWVKSTLRPEVLSGLGGFSGLFSLGTKKYKHPVLVSGTDGVGTKLRIAFLTGRHDTVGIDLVAMCVNDIIVSGAEPLFFLDYFATGKLQPEVTVEVIKGISIGCREAGCALIGGETAEMPASYPPGEYDLAGFSVGVVDKSKIIDGRKIKPKDVLIGLASSGLHSNAFSLARQILFEKAGLSVNDQVPELSTSLGEALLTPTRIYVKAIRRLLKRIPLKGIAHITGGGITDNLPRIFPEGVSAKVNLGAWTFPTIFELLKEKGALDPFEMLATFNMGIGMIVVVSSSDVDAALGILKRLGQEATVIGQMVAGTGQVIYD